MEKEYDFSKMKKRPGKVKVYPEAGKSTVNVRIDVNDKIDILDEAARLGIPYKELVISVLHRYVKGELVDLKAVDVKKLLKAKK